jgi:hypothetical protein
MHFPIIWGSLNLITLALASLAASASAAIARWSWTGSRTSLLQTLNFKIIKINRFLTIFILFFFAKKGHLIKLWLFEKLVQIFFAHYQKLGISEIKGEGLVKLGSCW